MKLPHLNGSKDHFLLSSIMVYTFMGIHFSYSSIHLQGGSVAAQWHNYTKFMSEIPPPPGHQPNSLVRIFCSVKANGVEFECNIASHM